MSLVEMMALEGVKSKKYRVEGNVIKDVHLVGIQAQNIVKPNDAPYVYKESALKEAVLLYENVDIYVGHAKGNEDRNPTDKIGYVASPVFKEGAGVFGDLVLNPKHTAFEAFVWWANNKPENLAMSHVARTFYDAKENAMTKIAKVYSVDFVSNGSTTHEGLFKEGVLTDKIMSDKWLCILLSTFNDAVYEIKYPLGKTLTQEDQAVQLVPVIEDLLSEVKKIITEEEKQDPDSTDTPASSEANKQKESKKENVMEYKDITLEDLKKNRKDLFEAISTEAVEAHIETEQAVKEAVSAVQEDARSDTFIKLVREAVVAGNDKLVTELVNDRKALASKTAVVVEAAAPARKHTAVKSDEKLDVKSVASLINKK
jgi:hypothetical protein